MILYKQNTSRFVQQSRNTLIPSNGRLQCTLMRDGRETAGFRYGIIVSPVSIGISYSRSFISKKISKKSAILSRMDFSMTRI